MNLKLLLTRDGFVRFVLTQINLHLEKVFAETVRKCFGLVEKKLENNNTATQCNVMSSIQQSLSVRSRTV